MIPALHLSFPMDFSTHFSPLFLSLISSSLLQNICIQNAYVRKCPRLLFHEEQEQQLQQDEDQRSYRSQKSTHEPVNESEVNHLNHATKGAEFASSPEGGTTTATTTARQVQDQDVRSNLSNSLGEKSGVTRVKYSQYLEFSVCPEVGLSKQDFKCAECGDQITFSNSRICDYDGMYYCFSCHWNDMERTPARILHNWDSSPRPVSRRSLQIITFIKRKPVLFDVLDFNPMLYGLVEELPLIKVWSAS